MIDEIKINSKLNLLFEGIGSIVKQQLLNAFLACVTSVIANRQLFD